MIGVDPFETGVLVPEVHERLVANLEGFASDAGIAPHWIYKPLDPELPELELNYVRNFPKHRELGLAGMCLLKSVVPVGAAEDRMSALAGAFLRNFIRAKVMTLGSALDALASGDTIDSTVLLIPNFCTGSAMETKLQEWHCRLLHDLMSERQTRGLQTVVYASELKRVSSYMGQPIADLIDSHYAVVGN